MCRYEAFAQVRADWIATAHTASDNLETLVHRMVRGASLHGLTAIPPRNGRFLRPLLRITREQVETHLAALEQTYVTDSTNLTDDYTRNRIRHHIIPAMQALNPAAERTVSYTLRSLRREDNFLTQQASAAYRCCHTAENTLDGLEQLHPALRFRCIAMLLEECGFSCDAPLLERLERLTRQGGRWNLSGDVYAVGKSGRLTIETCPKRRASWNRYGCSWERTGWTPAGCLRHN
ncbi:MAG: ATP-binding protein [Ruminococcus callidus]